MRSFSMINMIFILAFFHSFNLVMSDGIQFNFTTFQPKRYRIDLDKPIEPQYQIIYNDFIPQFELLVRYFRGLSQIIFLRPISSIFNFFQSNEFGEEVDMLARITGVSKNDVILINMLYELLCTSIVLNKDDRVIVGRNLDYEPRDILASVTYEVEVYKNNELFYIAANVFGNIGYANLNVVGKFTLSINQRLDRNKFVSAVRTSFGYIHPPYFLKIIAENANSYEEALVMLQEQKLTSSVYYILGGKRRNEGAIITRDYDRPIFVETLSEDQWFLVQTNYDRRLPDPLDDQRRVPAENRLNALKKDGVSEKELADNVLFLSPNFHDGTIYTSIHCASTNYLNTTVFLINELASFK